MGSKKGIRPRPDVSLHKMPDLFLDHHLECNTVNLTIVVANAAAISHDLEVFFSEVDRRLNIQIPEPCTSRCIFSPLPTLP